ncbi:hypothetical protein AB4254_11930 [Vibrio breoganii]
MTFNVTITKVRGCILSSNLNKLSNDNTQHQITSAKIDLNEMNETIYEFIDGYPGVPHELGKDIIQAAADAIKISNATISIEHDNDNGDHISVAIENNGDESLPSAETAIQNIISSLNYNISSQIGTKLHEEISEGWNDGMSTPESEILSEWTYTDAEIGIGHVYQIQSIEKHPEARDFILNQGQHVEYHGEVGDFELDTISEALDAASKLIDTTDIIVNAADETAFPELGVEVIYAPNEPTVKIKISHVDNKTPSPLTLAKLATRTLNKNVAKELTSIGAPLKTYSSEPTL